MGKLRCAKRYLAGNIAFFCQVFVIFSLTAFVQPPVLAAENTPAGFESLEEPQRSLIDIYYGNRFLTSQIATFTPHTILLSDAAAVIRLISAINDPALVETILGGEMETNSGNVCPTQEAENCGFIEPAVVGVIFDENRFRLDVFINRSLLLLQKADVRKYLPPSDAGFSLLQNLNGVWSGSDSSGDDYTFSGLSQLAERENGVYFDWDYTKNDHLLVNDLYGRRSFEGVEYNAGIVGSQAFGLSFTSDRTLMGARVASSNNTRNDTDFTGGTPLDVFLSTRGRVEIRRDDRLITSYSLEAGAQQLNTSVFPSGAYEIEIRILDDGGNTISTESRFFAKQFQLPPEGEWQYFAETGRVLNRTSGDALPSATEQWLTRAGVSRRLAPTVAGTVAVAATRDDSLIEFGLFNMGYLHDFSPSVMLVDNGDHGLNMNLRLHYGSVSANAYYRRLWKDSVTTKQKTYEKDHPPLLGGAFEQSNMAVSFPLVTGTMTYRYNENRQEGGQTTYTNDIDYRVSLLKTSDYTIDMSVGFSRSGDNDVAMMSFDFRLRDDRWTWQATPRAERRETNNNRDTSENLRVAASWDDLDLLESTVRVAMGAETGSEGERYDGRLTMGNSWGKSDFNFTHVVGDTNSSTSYAASFSTSFLTDGKHVAMGGNDQAESALVINVAGKKGDIFEVNIDGQRRGYAVAGRPSVIPLSPYKQYRVSLKQSALVLYNIDERERMVTLYPGNVVSMDYEAVALKLLFGRLLFDGVPMKNVRISGGQHPAESDDVGLFQLESLANVRILKMETDNGLLCTVPVPVPTSDSNYIQQMGTIDLNEANCESMPDEDMDISKQDVE